MNTAGRRIFQVRALLVACAIPAFGQSVTQGRFVLRETLHVGEDGKPITSAEDPDIVSCRVDFEVDPLEPSLGKPYSIKIFVANASDKPLALRDARLLVRINRETVPKLPVPLKVGEVGARSRVLIGETGGAWGDGIDTWVALVSVTSEAGNRCVNRIAFARR
jgi:hypothetical protein